MMKTVKFNDANGELRRVSVASDVTFAGLQRTLGEIAGCAATKVLYEDEDGDIVTVRSDAELQFALGELATPTLRLKVTYGDLFAATTEQKQEEEEEEEEKEEKEEEEEEDSSSLDATAIMEEVASPASVRVGKLFFPEDLPLSAEQRRNMLHAMRFTRQNGMKVAWIGAERIQQYHAKKQKGGNGRNNNHCGKNNHNQGPRGMGRMNQLRGKLGREGVLVVGPPFIKRVSKCADLDAVETLLTMRYTKFVDQRAKQAAKKEQREQKKAAKQAMKAEKKGLSAAQRAELEAARAEMLAQKEAFHAAKRRMQELKRQQKQFRKTGGAAAADDDVEEQDEEGRRGCGWKRQHHNNGRGFGCGGRGRPFHAGPPPHAGRPFHGRGGRGRFHNHHHHGPPGWKNNANNNNNNNSEMN